MGGTGTRAGPKRTPIELAFVSDLDLAGGEAERWLGVVGRPVGTCGDRGIGRRRIDGEVAVERVLVVKGVADLEVEGVSAVGKGTRRRVGGRGRAGAVVG